MAHDFWASVILNSHECFNKLDPEQTMAMKFLTALRQKTLAEHSQLLRRKKLAIRGGQVAFIAMMAVGITGRIMLEKPPLSRMWALWLILAGILYVLWYLRGYQPFVSWELRAPATEPYSLWPYQLPRKQILHFAVLFSLAILVCWLQGRRAWPVLAWMVLLPPVAQSVFLLGPGGRAVLVSAMSMAFLAGTSWWHRSHSVPRSLLAFSCAALFTLVFATLAATSERARVEVERLADELRVANQKLRTHAMQAEELATTRERNRLAREIHDSLGHYLTAVNMQIEAARALRNFEPDRTWKALDKVQLLTQQGLRDVRRSVAALRADSQDGHPFDKALREIAEGFSASGLSTKVEIRGKIRALCPQTRLALFRAGQEGLTNIRKHAHATNAWLELDFTQRAKVQLRVSDNGSGAASTNAQTEGFGLLGLSERVQLLGGTVRVQTEPNKGFSVEVEVPG